VASAPPRLFGTSLQQAKHRQACRARLSSLNRSMVETLARMYAIFRADPVRRTEGVGRALCGNRIGG